MPTMHFSSKGIKDFVERFLTKYNEEEETKKEPTRKCIDCTVELDEKGNWSEALKKECRYICRACDALRSKFRRMYVDGKYISKSHPLFKPGRYKGFTDAAFSSLNNYAASKEGSVYIMYNPSCPGWVKIGMAIDPEDRLKQYQTSSPYRNYEIVKSYKVTDRREAEAKAHEALTVKGRGRRGEWFYMGSTIAVSELDKLFINGEQLELF
jgi:hypothetical protein